MTLCIARDLGHDKAHSLHTVLISSIAIGAHQIGQMARSLVHLPRLYSCAAPHLHTSDGSINLSYRAQLVYYVIHPFLAGRWVAL